MPNSIAGGESPFPSKPLAWGMAQAEWRELFASLGQPAFRTRQIWEWLYKRRVRSFGEMANLPAALRARLDDCAALSPWTATDSVEADDGVCKLLLECVDGERIESVLIPSRDGRATVCVSTQAGCAFGCAFCATGKCGFDRDLSAGEIVGQFMAAAAVSESRPHGARPSNVVFMGMGEPFANYDNVLKAVRILNDPDGLAIGARRITLSTCGVVPGIKRLAAEGLQVELSVSLHAPEDGLRSRIMPVNRRWPLDELIAACRDYTEATGRIVTFEYTLVGGLNDSAEMAAKLAALARKTRGRVNLIPLSKVAHFEGDPPPPETCAAFMKALERAGVNATLRRSKGGSAAAACGQLRLGAAHRSAKG